MKRMNHLEMIDHTVGYVQQELENAEGGHDWWHVLRVWNNAKHIVKYEIGDTLIVELGALLHDIADSKFHDGNEAIGPEKAAKFLASIGVEPKVKEAVINIIKHISFKGGNETQPYSSPELDIVQDADRLDAIGAIGVARAFNYGGFKNREIYNPGIPPNLKMTKEEYKKSTAPTINHFYEKLLLLKDRMNTRTGKRMAEERHRFMESFLEQFYREWEGEV